MSTEKSEPSREQKLDEIIAAYVQAIEAGKIPDRQQLLARHLDLAAELAGFFADQDRFDRLAAPLRAMAPAARREVLRAGDAPAAGPTVEPPRTRVGYFGDYELLEEIAHGGMGVVYKARQRSLNRTVALKMLRAAPGASAADLGRFRAEAEAIANLDHPNIVPIHEIGEFEGRPYFTMKLIEGGSLGERRADLSREQHGLARLMATVARAVHHAHERGILHRDLKPANILLDAKGEPHVTDFGLAKRFHGDAGLTQSGAIVGTPSYMAPEQAAGRTRELTVAADVYSLGAILYELLTGRPPFRADTPLGTLRQVADEEPFRPRVLNPRVNRELETICLKCLDKDPQRRYASALELAEDLERFLKDLPIRARRPTVLGRTWRWARRHRPAAGVLFCLLAVVLALLALNALRAARMREMAMRAMHEAEFQRQRADANFRKARQAVDEMLTRVGESQLADVPQMDPVREQLLENALKYYQEFVEQERHDPDVRQQTAHAYLRMAALEQRLGRAALAEQAYRQAVALYERLAADSPQKPAYQADLARAYHHLGALLQSGGRVQEAASAYHRALAVDEKLVQDHPKVADHRRDLARDLTAQGELLAGMGRQAEATASYQKAVAIQQKLAADFPAVAEHRAALATNSLHLARLLRTVGQAAEVEAMYRQVLAIVTKMAADRPTNSDYRRTLAEAYTDLAALLQSNQRLAEAEATSRQALAIQQQLVTDFPTVPEYRSRLALIYLQVGGLLQTLGKLAEAEPLIRQALAIQQKLATDFPTVPEYRRNLAAGYRSLGALLASQGRAVEAEQVYRQALAILERLATDFPNVADYAKERAATTAELMKGRGEPGKRKSSDK
jgi:serine/threonine-protein kinase